MILDIRLYSRIPIEIVFSREIFLYTLCRFRWHWTFASLVLWKRRVFVDQFFSVFYLGTSKFFLVKPFQDRVITYLVHFRKLGDGYKNVFLDWRRKQRLLTVILVRNRGFLLGRYLHENGIEGFLHDLVPNVAIHAKLTLYVQS